MALATWPRLSSGRSFRPLHVAPEAASVPAMSRPRRLLLVFVAFATLTTLPAIAAPSMASATTSMTVRFLEGCHVGYRFGADGTQLGSYRSCLTKASSAPATARTWIPGRGVHLRIADGVWEGYAVPETPRSYVPGIIGEYVFPTPEGRAFPVGTYQGWRYDATFAVATAGTRAFLARASSAPVARYAVINGRPSFEVAAGIWIGQWVAATGASTSGPRMEYGPNPPSCRYADVLTLHRAYGDWGRTLLDTILMLPRTYAPGDLVDTGTAGVNGGYRVRSLIGADLRAMATAARAAGAPIAVVSGYRSYDAQAATFQHWVSVGGYEQALRTSARAGHSEHQLGTTIDVTSAGGAAPWTYADWGTTKAGAWMRSNAWRYGFVMSYPKGAEATTCYSYEPWHYRYVGRTTAANVVASGLPLRTYLWRMGAGG
jgi:zinc D-Ala-D-Ala carboxypeptidase